METSRKKEIMETIECSIRNLRAGDNATFTHDLFKSALDSDSSNGLNIVLGDTATIGSGATFLAEFICSETVSDTGSVVIKSINIKGKYIDNPARPIE